MVVANPIAEATSTRVNATWTTRSSRPLELDRPVLPNAPGASAAAGSTRRNVSSGNSAAPAQPANVTAAKDITVRVSGVTSRPKFRDVAAYIDVSSRTE